MSAILVDGCDLYGTDEAKAEAYGWARKNGTQEACITTGGRYGGPCFTMYYSHNGWQWVIGKTGVTTLFSFGAHKFDASQAFGSTYGIREFRNSAGVLMGRCKLNNLAQVVLYDANGAAQATSTEIMSPGIWYAVEVKFVAHATLGSIELWINGTQWAIATNIDTMPSSGNQYVEGVIWGAIKNGSTQWIDDLALWDDSGSDWNDWTSGKDLRIDTLRPNVDTAQEDFTPQGAGDNFAEVDDDPDHDADATFNESDVVGNKDYLGLTTITGTPDAIYNVRARAVTRKTNAGAALLKLGVYSGTTEGKDTAGAGLSSDYAWVVHDEEINPDDSLAWEKADIDALQVMYEHA